MILLDTQAWVWWMNGEPRLTARYQELIQRDEPARIGVSVISCWEVAKLVERGRLSLSVPVGQWIDDALTHPAVILLDLTPAIVVHSTQLPPGFHPDPADQMIVATARTYDVPLLTTDGKILKYPHVKLLR